MDEEEMEDHSASPRMRSNRRTPRTCVKNLNPSVYKETSQFSSQPVCQPKRKDRYSDEDPTFSEVEDADDLSDSSKKVPGYRCSPHLVPELMGSLSEKQRGWVRNIKWNALQHMTESCMPKSFTMWLVDRVDTDSGTLDVGGIPVDIREATRRILSLPSGNVKVPPPLNGRSRAKRARGDPSILDRKYSVNGRGNCAKDEMKLVIAQDEDEEEFCRSFVMLVLCIYAAPTTSLNINRNYLPALLDVSKIPLMDWCGFISDYLIQGIREFRDSTASHVQVPGCVHILPLMYVDALIHFKALTMPEALQLPEGEPRIHFIGTQHLYMVASLDVKYSSKSHTEYGALMESRSSILFESQDGHHFHEGTKDGNCPAAGHAQDVNNDTLESEAHWSVSISLEMKLQRELLTSEFTKMIQRYEQRILRKVWRRFTRPSAPTIIDASASRPADGTQNNPSSRQDAVKDAPLAGEESQKTDETVARVSAECTIGSSTVPVEKVLPCSPTTELRLDSLISNNVTVRCSSSAKQAPKMVQKFYSRLNFQTTVGNDEDGKASPVRDGEVPADPSNSPSKLFSNPTHDGEYSDCMKEAVDIGAAAVFEVNMNHEYDRAEDDRHAPLSLLSEAAFLHSSPMFDRSPAGPTNSCNDLFHAGRCDAPTRYGSPSPVHSAFVNLPRKSDLSADENRFDGSAMFDKYTATPAGIADCRTPQCKAPIVTPPDHASSESITILPEPPFHLLAINANTTFPIARSVSSAHPECQANNRSSDRSSEDSLSTSSHESDSEDKTLSGEVDLEEKDDLCESDEVPAPSFDDFMNSPTYTFHSQDVIDIPDDPQKPPPCDIRHIPPLQEPLAGGARFKFGGSVSAQTNRMYQKYKKLEKNELPCQDIGNYNFIQSKVATKTYKEHVIKSSVKKANSKIKKPEINRMRTKIQIKRCHITKGDFVDSLKPQGEVCKSLMGLCSVAIMCDWDCKTKVIIDQDIINELLKDGHICDQEAIAARLKKLPLDEIEKFYLPILTGNHWFLAVINFLSETVEFYDSLLVVKEGCHPHKDIWQNLASNLERAYCRARKKSVYIFFFNCVYPGNSIQTNIHDCGFHVIRMLECHGTEDIVGYSKKRTMMPFRRYLSHTLIYHRFNDLNPLRPYLREETP